MVKWCVMNIFVMWQRCSYRPAFVSELLLLTPVVQCDSFWLPFLFIKIKKFFKIYTFAIMTFCNPDRSIWCIQNSKQVRDAFTALVTNPSLRLAPCSQGSESGPHVSIIGVFCLECYGVWLLAVWMSSLYPDKRRRSLRGFVDVGYVVIFTR